jgi:hypothetical protein
MADLSERGQILLIAAFALAVTFVALAVVVNSAIYTENLASRGEVAGSSEGVVYQHQIVQSTGEAIGFANRYNYSSPGMLEDSLEQSLSTIGRLGGAQQARGGQLVNVSYVGETIGTRIAENASGGSTFLENSGSREDWQLAEDVDRTRNFQIEAHKSGLETSQSSAFSVIANESNTNDDIWQMWIYRDGIGGDFLVEVEPADGGSAETCRFGTSGIDEYDIDVTDGTVNEQRCHALTRSGTTGRQMWFGTGIPSSNSYNITFQNGNDIQGNYSLVIQGTANTSNLAPSPTNVAPFETEAIYDATIDYVYLTSNIRYQTEIRVAPGEVPR